jgi:hypothetical protein
MRKVIALGCMTVASLLGLGIVVVGQECKPEIVVATGSAAFTKTGAEANAISPWRREVVSRYGEFFADFESAGGHAIPVTAAAMKLDVAEKHMRGSPRQPGKLRQQPSGDDDGRQGRSTDGGWTNASRALSLAFDGLLPIS